MNFNVGDILQPRYDVALIVASYIVSVLGSFAALTHAQYMFRKDRSLQPSMAIGAAVSLGGVGIWTMHFVGMMGYQLPLRVVYDGFWTVLSLVAAIVIAGIALVLAGGRGKFNWVGWAAGSLLAGVGVCVMHYMGMYAMNLRADMRLDLTTVAISFAIAVTASGAALWLAFHAVKVSHRIAAAVVMGIAVCTMHYTGMSAAEFICIASKAPPVWAIQGTYLPQLVVGVAGLVLVLLTWNVLGHLGRAEKEARRQRPRGPAQPAVRVRPRGAAGAGAGARQG